MSRVKTKQRFAAVDPAMLPGGKVYEEYQVLMRKSLERLDFLSDDWVVEGRPAPSFVPPQHVAAVRAAREAALKTGGLHHRLQRTADAALVLRDAARRLKMTRPGRPAGPSLDDTRPAFERRLKQALLTLSEAGERATLAAVASQLGRHEKTLQRDLRKFGYSSWPALRRHLSQ